MVALLVLGRAFYRGIEHKELERKDKTVAQLQRSGKEAENTSYFQLLSLSPWLNS